ncbi:MAG TPA: protein-disulfide reductase DsbD [Steroidobacteraceae bacterium]|nr:protein-disulfide reductase DsbD [Steroidobacteraceae bacterium]
MSQIMRLGSPVVRSLMPRATAAARGALMIALGLSSMAVAGRGVAADGPATPASIDQVLHRSQVRSNEGEFLPPDQAFRLIAQPQGADRIALTWEIADGYYLYRNRLKVATDAPVKLGELALPTGQSKTDEYFGTQQVYHNELRAILPVVRSAGASALTVPVRVTYQGCADAGLCYPPITKTLSITLGPGGAASGAAAASAAAPVFVSEQDRYASMVRSGSWLGLIAFFYAAGLVLAFTPCVLPMVPIVSGIIVGERDVTAARGFLLSLTYVMGMALTYTAAGIAVAAGGSHVQAAFQQPWILGAFAAVFVVLALSMFGLFTLQMPAAIQTRLSALSNRQSAGTLGGVFMMGALSALIVTTCVAPALVGALVVIGQSGDVVRGGIALFVMALGMGTPLLAIGASAGKLLPKAGAWMDTVKSLFGALMLGVAAWMLARILPERVSLILWAVPAVAAAVVLWSGARRLGGVMWLPARLGAAAAALYGLVLITGAALGGTDPLAPLPALAGTRPELAFHTIKSVGDLQSAVSSARAQSRPVMLDFYADWCVSCKEMQKYTFTDARVRSALRNAVLLRADVTHNDADDQALLKHFGIYGPPTIAFYGADGHERRDFRVVGYMNAPQFVSVVQKAITSTLAQANSSKLVGNARLSSLERAPAP